MMKTSLQPLVRGGVLKVGVAIAATIAFSSPALAYCYKAPCDQLITTQKTQTLQVIQQAFDQLNSSLGDLDTSYSNYKQSLQEQNELLEKLKKIRAYNSESLKEIAFLLNQNNYLDSNFIDALMQQSEIEILESDDKIITNKGETKK